MFHSNLIEMVEELLHLCRQRKLTVSTAESCTGGLLAALLTELPGSSKVFERGFVTYSNDSKAELLGVSKDLIELHGAVSQEIALAMAQGALKYSCASIAVSITGVAGPGGGTDAKPVGLVFLTCIRAGLDPEQSLLELGNRPRQEIRATAVAEAIRLIRRQAER
jgi:nicotinamide-nucleotide amidase